MAAYPPPRKGLDLTPQLGLPAPSRRLGGDNPVGEGSQDVLVRTQSVVDTWLAAQRQNVAAGTIGVYRTQLDHPEVDVQYLNIQGREVVTVSPKPQPTTRPTPQEQPTSEAQQPIVTPPEQVAELPPTLYLMVLYGTNKIAAVRMDSLPQVVIDYAGVSHGSTWTSSFSTLQTLQLKIGGTEYILTQIDLSGKTAAEKYMLSTTALSDAVKTDGPMQAVPMMNGMASDVYAMGGAYTYTSGKLKQTEAAAMDGGNLVIPIAIDQQGLGYVQPGISAGQSVTIDPNSTREYSSSDTLSAAANSEIQSLSTEDVDTYGCAVFEILDYGTEYDTDGPYQQIITLNARTAIITTGPYNSGSSVANYTYYGTAEPGSLPTMTGFDYQSYQGVVTSYTGNKLFTSVIVGSDKGTMSGVVPAMVYDTGKVTVELLPVVSSLTGEITVTDDGPLGVAAYPVQVDTLSYPGNSTYDKSIGHTVTIYGTIQVPHGVTRPPYQSSYEATQKYFDDFVNAASLQLNGRGVENFTSKPVVGKLYSGFAGGAEVTGEYNGLTPGDGTPPEDTISLTITSGATYSACSCINYPLMHANQYTGSRTTSTTAFGVTLGSDASSSYATDGLLYEPFPFALGTDKLFYIHQTSNSRTVYTPYDSYTSTGSIPFRGWLNLSNGSHLLQGYVIDDNEAHLFYDEEPKDILPDFAEALKVDAGTIAAMFMDIKLDQIKNLSDIQPPSYD